MTACRLHPLDHRIDAGTRLTQVACRWRGRARAPVRAARRRSPARRARPAPRRQDRSARAAGRSRGRAQARTRAAGFWCSAFQVASLPTTATKGRSQRTAVSNSAMWKPKVPSPMHGDHGRRRVGGAGGDGERDRRADGAGGAVDEAATRRQQRLRPLPDLAAVAHEDGVGVARRGRARARGTARRGAACPARARRASPRPAGGRRRRR